METVSRYVSAKMKEINAPVEIVELKQDDLRRVTEIQASLAKQNQGEGWADWAQNSFERQGELILTAATDQAMYPDPDATKPQVEEVVGVWRMARG